MGGRTRPGPRWVLTSPLPIHTRAPEFPMGLAKKSELRGNQEVAGNRRHSLSRVVVPLPGLLLQGSAGLGSCCRWTPGFEKGARFGHHWPPVLRHPPLLARIARVPCAHLVRGMRTSGASLGDKAERPGVPVPPGGGTSCPAVHLSGTSGPCTGLVLKGVGAEDPGRKLVPPECVRDSEGRAAGTPREHVCVSTCVRSVSSVPGSTPSVFRLSPSSALPTSLTGQVLSCPSY